MNLSLKKPLCFFDLETTGLNITQDRIVQIAIVKLDPEGNTTELNLIINPEIEISIENAAIHGITNEIAGQYKNFKENAAEIIEFIANSDLAGYNSNKFDIPFLAEEFLRNEIEFSFNNRKFIDVQNIFHKMEQRTLAAAYAFYCNKELLNAHNAIHDVKATKEILIAQLMKYTELKNNVDFLASFSQTNNLKMVDLAGRLAENINGEITYNYGKHKGKTVLEVSRFEPGYYGWMMNADFPLDTKKHLKTEMERIKLTNNQNSMNEKLKDLKNKFNSK